MREIHVCGPVYVIGEAERDDHQELSKDDYALLEWTLGRTDAQILTLEYPKARTIRHPLAVQLGALERQLTRLKALTS